MTLETKYFASLGLYSKSKLPDLALPVPVPSTIAPGDVFDPPVGPNPPAPNAPIIAAMTTQGNANDVMTAAVDQGSPNTVFIAYAAAQALQPCISLGNSNNRDYSFILPPGLNAGMALIWAFDAATGHSTPFPINRTFAGSFNSSTTGGQSCIPGDTVYITGRNLTGYAPMIYFVPNNLSSIFGMTPTIVSPELMTFVMPTLAAGNWQLWVHNGRGGKYGFYQLPQTLVITTLSSFGVNYSAHIINVPAPNGTDDTVNINAAIASAAALNAPATLVFQAGGGYQLAQQKLSPVGGSGTGILLQGSGGTTLTTVAGFNDACVIDFGGTKGAVSGLAILTTGGTVTTARNASGIIGGVGFQNVTVDTRNVANMSISPNISGVVFNNVTIDGAGIFLPGGVNNFVITDNNFNVAQNTTQGGPITMSGNANGVIANNTAQDLNTSLYPNAGRFAFMTQSICDSVYIGENTFTLADHLTGNQNAGEHIVSEIDSGKQSSMVNASHSHTSPDTIFNTIYTTDALGSWATGYVANSCQFYISDGKGRRQWGFITAVDTVNQKLSIARINGMFSGLLSPLAANSRVNIVKVASNIFVHGNNQSSAAGFGTASAQFALFGGGLGCVSDSNTCAHTNNGVAMQSLNATDNGSNCTTPLLDNIVLDNTFTDVGTYGQRLWDDGPSVGETLTMGGNVFRNNNVTMRIVANPSPAQADWSYESYYGTAQMDVWDKNTATNSAYGVQLNPFGAQSCSPSSVIALYQNNISLGGGTSAGSIALNAIPGIAVIQNPASGQFTGFGAPAGGGGMALFLASPPQAYVVPGNNLNEVFWHTSVNAAKYRLYRSIVYPPSPVVGNQIGGDFNSAQFPYTDSTAVNGTTYYYAVTAVDASGNETTSAPTQALLYPLQSPVYTDLQVDQYNPLKVTSATYGSFSACGGDTLRITSLAGGWTAGNYMGLLNQISTTSTANLTVQTGTVTFTGVDPNLNIAVGADMRACDTATRLLSMFGTVHSYSGTILVALITRLQGTGSATAWTIGVAMTGIILDRSPAPAGTTGGIFTIQNKPAFAISAATPSPTLTGPRIAAVNLWLPLNEPAGQARACSRFGKKWLETKGGASATATVNQYTSPSDGKIGAQFVAPSLSGFLSTTEGNGYSGAGYSWRAWALVEFQATDSQNHAIVWLNSTPSGTSSQYAALTYVGSLGQIAFGFVDNNVVAHSLFCSTANGPAPPPIATGPTNRLFICWGLDAANQKIVVDLYSVATGLSYHYELTGVTSGYFNINGFANFTIGDVVNGSLTFPGVVYQLGMTKGTLTTAQIQWIYNNGALQNYANLRQTPPSDPGDFPLAGLKTIQSNFCTTDDADLPNNQGLSWFCCYSIAGTALATTKSANYLWLFSCDHTGRPPNDGVYVGFSNDPGIRPVNWQYLIPDPTHDTPNGLDPERPFYAYNPDNGYHYVFYEAFASVGVSGGQPLFGIKTLDFVTFTRLNVVILPTTATNSNLTAYASVIRLAPNSWIAYHMYCDGSISPFITMSGYSVSTTPETFEVVHPVTGRMDGYTFNADYPGLGLDIFGIQPFLVNGVNYIFSHAGVFGTYDASGNYLGLEPITTDADGYLSIQNGPLMRFNYYPGPYPGLSWVRDVHTYLQDGILFAFLSRGFPQVTQAGPNGTFPYSGQQNIDLMVAYLNDTANLALSNVARPIGTVALKSSSTTITISCLDALYHQRYRLYRSTNGSVFAHVADFVGLSYTDTPGTGATYTYYLTARADSSPYPSTEGQPGVTTQPVTL